jgi:hypothetical protein
LLAHAGLAAARLTRQGTESSANAPALPGSSASTTRTPRPFICSKKFFDASHRRDYTFRQPGQAGLFGFPVLRLIPLGFVLNRTPIDHDYE